MNPPAEVASSRAKSTPTSHGRRSMIDPFGPVSAGYEMWFATPLGAFVAAEEERALIDAVPDGGGRLLDVGAGTGWSRTWYGWLHCHGSGAIDRDVSRGRVAWRPIDRMGGGQGRVLALRRLDLRRGARLTVLEFVSDPGRAMAEAWRVLRPAGTLVVGPLDALSPWVARYRCLGTVGSPHGERTLRAVR